MYDRVCENYSIFSIGKVMLATKILVGENKYQRVNVKMIFINYPLIKDFNLK